jgi:hypothetical protein
LFQPSGLLLLLASTHPWLSPVDEVKTNKMSMDSLGNDHDSEKLLQYGSDSSSHKAVDEYLTHRRHESRQILRYKFGGMFILTLLVATILDGGGLIIMLVMSNILESTQLDHQI